MRGTLLAAAGTVALLVGDTGTAGAEPIPDVVRTTTTHDGWTLTVSKRGENLTRTPNLAVSPLTREDFATVEFTADISGPGKADIRNASLTGGYEIGCQLDFTQGMKAGMGGFTQPELGGGVGTSPEGRGNFQVQVAPTLEDTVRPGTHTTMPLVNKPLTDHHASTRIEEADLKIDGCGGATMIRSYAVLSVSTAESDNQVTVYGAPTWM